VALVGFSQGGQAALFAGQLAPSYAPQLFIVGVVSEAPVTSLFALASSVPPGPRSVVDQRNEFVMMALFAWSTVDPAVSLPSLLTPQATRLVPVLAGACSGEAGSVVNGLPPSRLFRTGWEHEGALAQIDEANDPGHAPTTAPILVVQGTADTLIPAAATHAFVRGSLCRQQGDVVDYAPLTGSGHGDVVNAGLPLVMHWLAQRLAGRAAPDSCAR
jgi:pimeloyl-ACP methyl ester carboxylesterase